MCGLRRRSPSRSPRRKGRRSNVWSNGSRRRRVGRAPRHCRLVLPSSSAVPGSRIAGSSSARRLVTGRRSACAVWAMRRSSCSPRGDWASLEVVDHSLEVEARIGPVKFETPVRCAPDRTGPSYPASARDGVRRAVAVRGRRPPRSARTLLVDHIDRGAADADARSDAGRRDRLGGLPDALDALRHTPRPSADEAAGSARSPRSSQTSRVGQSPIPIPECCPPHPRGSASQ